MFEINQHYLFFTWSDLGEGVGQQSGKVVAIDGPLIKIERREEVYDIVKERLINAFGCAEMEA